MPRRKFAWLTPDAVDEGDLICHPLLIPRVFSPMIMGALWELTQDYNWEESGAVTIADATQWMTALLVSANETECGVASMDVRQSPTDPCVLEKEIAPDTWEAFADLTQCAGEELLKRYNPTTGELESSPDGTTWTENRGIDPRFTGVRNALSTAVDCDDAKYIVGYVQEYLERSLDDLDLAGNIMSAVGIATGVLIAVLSGGILAAAVIPMIAAIYNVGASAVRTALTSAVWEELVCIVFCELDSLTEVSDDKYDAIRAAVLADIGGIAGQTLWNAITSMGPVGLQNAIALQQSASGVPADCDDCSCNEPWSECSFNGLGQRIWVESETRVWSNFAKIAGSYDSVNDRYDGSLQGIASTTRFHGTTLEINFSPQIITHVDATGWASHTTNTATVLYHIALLRNGVVVASAGLTGTGTKQVVWDGSVESDEIVVTVRAGRINQSPTSFISEICVEGNGINPFV